MKKFEISTIDAHSGFSSFSFAINNCVFHLGKTTVENEEKTLKGLTLDLGYDSFGRLICNLSSGKVDTFVGLAMMIDYLRVVNKEHDLDAEFLSISANSARLQMLPRNPPLKIGTGKEIGGVNKVTAYLLNGPKILIGEQLSVFSYENVQMTLTDTDAGRKARGNERYYTNDKIITHKIELAIPRSLNKHMFFRRYYPEIICYGVSKLGPFIRQGFLEEV